MSVRRITSSGSVVIAVAALVVGLAAPAAAHQVTVVAHRISGSTIKVHTIAGNRLKHNTLTGTQIKESTLGTVPMAANAQRLDGKAATSYVQTGDAAGAAVNVTKTVVPAEGGSVVDKVALSGGAFGDVNLVCGPSAAGSVPTFSLPVGAPTVTMFLTQGAGASNASISTIEATVPADNTVEAANNTQPAYTVTFLIEEGASVDRVELWVQNSGGSAGCLATAIETTL